MFRTLLESIELQKISDFSDFCDTLSFYIEYNQGEDLEKYLKELKSLGMLTKSKKLYKIIRIEDPEKFIPGKNPITSASTKILKGDMLDSMKDTIDQYVQSGDFYLVTIDSAEGLDVNAFYKKYFKGKQKEMTKDEVIGNQPIGQLFDTFKEKSKQNEFIIYGSFKIKNIERI